MSMLLILWWEGYLLPFSPALMYPTALRVRLQGISKSCLVPASSGPIPCVTTVRYPPCGSLDRLFWFGGKRGWYVIARNVSAFCTRMKENDARLGGEGAEGGELVGTFIVLCCRWLVERTNSCCALSHRPFFQLSFYKSTSFSGRIWWFDFNMPGLFLQYLIRMKEMTVCVYDTTGIWSRSN